MVEGAARLERRKSSIDAKKSELLAFNAHGNFSPDVLSLFQSNPRLIAEVAHRLLDAHFPDSLHSDIVAAVGLELNVRETVMRNRRDSTFRSRVLSAYEYQCAVCKFDIRLGTVPLAIEAAHIKWYQAGGPEVESNGICFCSLHHKLFDLGAFALVKPRVLLVSDHTYGGDGLQDWLLRFHGHSIRPAIRAEYAPSAGYLDWHFREVFKQPARQT